VARESFQSGPQIPNLPKFGLIFDGNIKNWNKNINQSGPRMFQQHFLGCIEI
jgi:hypothetical protein